MSKNKITYEVSMEQLKKYIEETDNDFFRKFDITNLRDPVFRRYLYKKIIMYLIFLVFVVLFMLLLSASTSPLYKDFCDGDSSIFMLIGKGINSGKELYKDYFDHKGPLLFYLNALGLKLTGTKSGVFIIQCIFLWVTSIFMYKTARIFTKTTRAVICTLISVAAFGATISDGNFSEDYCMLFCMIPIYLSVRYFAKAPDMPHPFRYMYIYGICFALCAFTRINNGLIICGIVLTAVVTDFINDHIKESLKNIMCFLLGILTVTVPICLFFIVKGTFSDMIFSTFTFNFMYASNGSDSKTASDIMALILWILPVISMVVVSSIFAKRLGPRVASLISTMSVFALIPIILGFGYTHYYTTLIPLIPIYTAMFFFLAGNRINFPAIMLCVIMVFTMYNYISGVSYNTAHYLQKLYKQQKPNEYSDVYSDIYYSAKSLSSYIPEEERDSVFGYNVSSAWFLTADIMPCYRLFTLQESWATNYPEFGRAINEMMIETPPKWVIIHNIDIIQSRQLLNIIKDNYTLVSEFEYDMLYKHN